MNQLLLNMLLTSWPMLARTALAGADLDAAKKSAISDLIDQAERALSDGVLTNRESLHLAATAISEYADTMPERPLLTV